MTKNSILNLIEMLINYHPDCSEPSKLKIIFGISNYASRIQQFETGIDIYNQFG